MPSNSPSPPPITVNEIMVGKAVPFGRVGQRSAISKRPVRGATVLDRTGLRGDEQGDARHHGGSEKAVHHYPFDHYLLWREELPDQPQILSRAGAFGENVSASGLTENDVCIGDVWQIGSAAVAVSQGRQPCWKLNVRFGVNDMARRVQDTLRTGWYYRVVQPGSVCPGDALQLIERPHPAWSVRRVMHILYRDPMNLEGLHQIAELHALTPSWRELALRRLTRRSVEKWEDRLVGSHHSDR